MPPPALAPDRLRRVYDRVGAAQDRQGWYEDPAVDVLVRHGAFEGAEAVFEMGCGTGRLAARLLTLAPEATYRGTDLSPVMVGLARARLAPFGGRATVALVDGGPPTAPPGSADRFVASYVLDTLSAIDIARTLDAAHRMLAPGGRLCVASLSDPPPLGASGGAGLVANAVGAGWRALYRVRPTLVGGCRPVEVVPYLDEARWTIAHAERVTPWGVPSEAVVAVPRKGEGGV